VGFESGRLPLMNGPGAFWVRLLEIIAGELTNRYREEGGIVTTERDLGYALELLLGVRNWANHLDGDGAFGNPEAWINAAIRRALTVVVDFDLDIRLVSYGAPSKSVLQIVEEFR
jgi:hypothetical protein